MSFKELGMLVALGFLWGISFIFIRVTSSVLGPFTVVELRTLLAAISLVIFAVLAGTALKARERWRGFLVLGTLNAAIPFVLISAGQIVLTASFGAILNSTTPLFGAIIAAIWLGDSFTIRKVLGLLAGISGVGVLVGWSPVPVDSSVALGILAALGGALFYGIGSAYAKVNFDGIPPVGMAVGQLGGAAAVTLPFAALDARDVVAADISTAVVFSMLGMAILSTAVAYLIYFRLLDSVGPTKTLTVTFLVPVFGVLLGALLLGEPVGGGVLPGLGIILISLVLVNEIHFGKPKATKSS